MKLCKNCKTELRSYIREWQRAYPEDVFPPIREGEIDVSRSRAGATMAQHVLRILLRDVNDAESPS